MPLLRVVRVAMQDEIEKGLEIRKEVFVEEQGVPAHLETAEPEGIVEYFMAEYGEKPVGTGRLCIKEAFVKFERVAVSKEMRGKGVGGALMEEMERFAFQTYPAHLQIMHAQADSEPFYKKRGWIGIGELFLEANISHRLMIHPPEDTSHLLCLNDPNTPEAIQDYFKA